MFWVYILGNPAGKFYVGQTNDLDRRIKDHNLPSDGTGKYSRKNGPWQLVWSEKHSTRSSAMIREKFIKSRKSSEWIRLHLLNL